MRKIQMVDLVTQYQKIKDEVDQAIQKVVDSAAFIRGPQVKSFEDALAAYTGSKHAIACANGTDALQMAMMALDLQPGDEVILPCFTYVATAEVIALLKLTPVLVDVNPDTFNIDPEAIEKAITPKTRAIVPVHLFGQCADMEEIMALANKHKLYVIEDVAQAIGADYTFSDGSKKKSGTIGHIGCTSFFPSKNLGCMGDGGAMFTQDEQLAKRIRMIANHGQSTLYYHDDIGVNSRLDTIQAAVLEVKLKYLDEYLKARQSAADYYDKAFSGHPNLKIPVRSGRSSHVFHQYTLQLSNIDRAELKNYLAEKGIPAMVYYPLPLHHQKAYASERFTDEKLPVSVRLCSCVLSLPMHTELDREQLEFITGSVLEFCNSHRSMNM